MRDRSYATGLSKLPDVDIVPYNSPPTVVNQFDFSPIIRMRIYIYIYLYIFKKNNQYFLSVQWIFLND